VVGLAQVAWVAAVTAVTAATAVTAVTAVAAPADQADQAADDLARAIAAGRALPASRQRAFVFTALARAALQGGQATLAEELIAIADAAAGQADEVLQAGTLAALSTLSGISPVQSAHLRKRACEIALVDDLPRRLAAQAAVAEYAVAQPDWRELFAPFAARAGAASAPLERSQALAGLADAHARAGRADVALQLAAGLEEPVVRIRTLAGLARPLTLAGDPGGAHTALRLARSAAEAYAPAAPPGADPVSWACVEIVAAALSCGFVPLAQEAAAAIRDPDLAAAASVAMTSVANLTTAGFWLAPSPWSTGYFTLPVAQAACAAGRAKALLSLIGAVPDAQFGAVLAAEIAEAALETGDRETAQAALRHAIPAVIRPLRARLGSVADRARAPARRLPQPGTGAGRRRAGAARSRRRHRRARDLAGSSEHWYETTVRHVTDRAR
jgi:hypothetical protein